MTLRHGSRLGPYEILSPLGAGGMGEVYRARDPRLGREVAIKVLPVSFSADPDRLRRFEHEARAAGVLNHPNITAVFDVGSFEGSPYVVSELLEGETLRERLLGGALAARKAIDYAIQIAHGLAAAHEKGIVHRDLKPENLFVTRDGRVKVLDFGLAKLTQPEKSVSGLTELPTATAGTEPGVVLGTLGYMSPEQVRGRPADVRSDIFAFGAILYEMLSGRHAFRGESAADTMSAILTKELPDLSETNRSIPPGLERVVRHCLEKSPEERFHSAHDLAFDLQSLSGETASGGRAAVAAGVGFARRRVALPAAVVVAAAALLAGVFADRFLLRRPAAGLPRFQPLTFRQGLVSTARFAPDGETVVYGAAWDGSPFEVFAARRESPESRPLGFGSADLVAVSGSGDLAILLDRHFTKGWESRGTLALVPLAGGAPREVVEDVMEADFAPDGKALAVVREVGGRVRLEFPIGKVLYETEGWLSHCRVRPQGDRIAFVDHPLRGDDDGPIVVVDLNGKKTLLDPGGAKGLAWTPDGEEVWASIRTTVFSVSLEGRRRDLTTVPGGVWLLDVSRTGRAILAKATTRREIMGLAPGETREHNLSWFDWSYPTDLSRDGRFVLFQEQGRGQVGGEYPVYLRKTDGSPAARLGETMAISLSPDGRWALSIQRASTDPRLLLLPIGAGQTRLLSSDPIRYQPWAAWLPDGQRFLIAGASPGNRGRLYVRDIEGGPVRPVTPEGILHYGTVVSPDGKFVTAITAEGRAFAFPVDGGEPRPIPWISAGESPLRWGTDPRFLFVVKEGQLPTKIERLDLETGKREPWKELSPGDPAGVFSIEPILMTGDGKAYIYSYRRLITQLFLVEGMK